MIDGNWREGARLNFSSFLKLGRPNTDRRGPGGGSVTELLVFRGPIVRRLTTGGKRIRTISPTVAFGSWRWSDREISAAESLSFSRGTNGSNPLCSSGESDQRRQGSAHGPVLRS